MNGRIHSIESFGTVDGPGLRFVVFLQGCPMRCLYCHNPDTWETQAGTLMSVTEILSKFEKNRSFYKNGGITVTGGEPLLQLDFLIELFEEAKKCNIHTCIDSSGIVFYPENKTFMDKLDRLLAVTDLIMLDIKHINSTEHKKLTSHSNEPIIGFARYLEKKQVDIWVRHVVVPTITYNKDYLYETGRFIGSLSNVRTVEVLPYHTMGVSKYESMGIDYPLKGIPDLSKEDLKIAREWLKQGINDVRRSAESTW